MTSTGKRSSARAIAFRTWTCPAPWPASSRTPDTGKERSSPRQTEPSRAMTIDRCPARTRPASMAVRICSAPPTASGPTGAKGYAMLRMVRGTATSNMGESSRVAAGHPGAELGVLLQAARRAGVVGLDAAVLRGEAVGEGDVELVDGLHLAVEPGVGAGPEAVRPGEAGAQLPDAELAEAAHGVVQPVVLE